ncbi:hypothetical protein BDR26DRAFT_871671 [Obelidium mucronatum]|nr:hypothetical protein BDR26DRAFT_871671 [Obelidium mucronatum]
MDNRDLEEAELRAESERLRLESENLRLKLLQLQEKDKEQKEEIAKLQQMQEKDKAQKLEIAKLQQSMDRLKAMADMKEMVPFTFPAQSTPLLDIQFAYHRLPAGILSSEDMELLDAAVADGDIGAIRDFFGTLANQEEYYENPLIQAIDDRAAENEDSPHAYLTDILRETNQMILATAMLIVMV